MVLLSPSRLHDSLGAPVLGSIGFLNEVMGRFPDAISFAPGAPHPDTLPDPDIQHYTDRFLRHLGERGMGPERARRMLFEYGPSRGIINDIVSEALWRDHGIETSPEDVVVTVGAQEGMFLVLRALFGSAEDILAVADPCFVGITGAARMLGLDVVPVAEGTQGIDLEALTAACRDARLAGRAVRALYVAPDFSNPGGGRMPLASRHRLLELAEQEDFLILEDNAYGFTATVASSMPSLKALDTGRRVVHIGTFAKVAFPGARVGYVVADQRVGGQSGPTRPLAAELATLKTMVTVNTSPLSQAVIGGMLLEHGGSLATLGRHKAELYQRNLTCLAQALDRHLTGVAPPGVRWNRPEGGFFVRVHLPVRADPALLEVSAAKYGVLWTPMEQFYAGGAGDHQIRLSCSYLDPREIEEGVRRLAAFLTKEIGT
ncbi:aminotransferase-like domain-containing protein [Streptomyces sp. NPDC002104]